MEVDSFQYLLISSKLNSLMLYHSSYQYILRRKWYAIHFEKFSAYFGRYPSHFLVKTQTTIYYIVRKQGSFCVLFSWYSRLAPFADQTDHLPTLSSPRVFRDKKNSRTRNSPAYCTYGRFFFSSKINSPSFSRWWHTHRISFKNQQKHSRLL